MKKTPFYPLLFAIFPVLVMLANNITEVYLSVAIRPLMIALLLGGICFSVSRLVLRNWNKAALLTAFLLILFYSYGHIYTFIRGLPEIGEQIGRHRYMAVALVLSLLAGGWLILFRIKRFRLWNAFLNLTAIVLMIFPLARIAGFTLQQSALHARTQSMQTNALQPVDSAPDIYYIILDTYTRADYLQKDYGFDNSPFLNELRQLGFEVADCSRSNYDITLSSMVSTLNMDFLANLLPETRNYYASLKNDWSLLRQNSVRRLLEDIGYRTVSFETGYPAVEWNDADYYFSSTTDFYTSQNLTPFEVMLFNSTAAVLPGVLKKQAASTQIIGQNQPFGFHIAKQRYILEQLKQMDSLEGPKFVYAHILVPHVPYIFAADGTLQTDPGYYDGEGTGARDAEYLRLGYTAEIQFINDQILNVVTRLINQSKTPPVIIIQGDHGLKDENRSAILNAIYLPGDHAPAIHAGITPVNTFRVVFNEIFNAKYSLLPDWVFTHDSPDEPVMDQSEACSLKP